MNYIATRILIDPLRSGIQVTADLRGSFETEKPAFYLNENFQIESVTSQGTSVGFRLSKESQPLPFMAVSRPVFLAEARKHITVRYSGCIREPVGMDNVISESRVELSFHSCYHPALVAGGGPTAYEVEVTLPEAYVLLANGQLTQRESPAGTVTYSFRTVNDEAGVFLFAAKDYQINRLDSPLYKLASVVLDSADAGTASDGLANLAAVLGYYERKYCALKTPAELTYVISPRGSGAYVFGNIIVVPGQGEFRFPKDDYRYVEFPAHEAAHLYWNFSSYVQNEDWVIEGLAAYSAFSFLMESATATLRLQMLEHQLQELLACRSSDPVAGTPAGSVDFGANRGVKPAWLYYYLNGKSGALDVVFASLYREYSDVDCISARTFTTRLGESLRPEDGQFLISYLTKPGWTPRDARDLYDGIVAIP